MRPSIRRAALGAALVVASALALPSFGDDLIACSKKAPGAIDVRKDGWAKIRFPLHAAGEGPAAVTSFATSPGLQNRMFSTNGHVIKATADAGCTWNTIYRGNQPQPPPAPGAPDGSVSIDVDNFTHLVATANDTLWTAAYDDNNGVPKPRAYSLDLGPDGNNAEPPQTTVDNGLPPVGLPVAFDVTPGFDPAAYMLVEGAADTSPIIRARRLYTTFLPSEPPQTATVGTIWEELELPPALGEIDGLDATSGRQVLVWSGSDFAVSQDTQADEVVWQTGQAGGEIVTVVVDTNEGVATLVVKSAQGTHGVLVELSSAKMVGTLSFPTPPTSIALGQRDGVIAVSGPKGTFGYDVGLDRWLNLTPKGAKQPLNGLRMANGVAGRYLVGAAADAFWRFDTFDWELFRAPPPLDFFGDLNLGTVPRSNLKNLVLSPTRTEVTIQPGQLHRQPVKLRVPPDPNKLDVFFIVDTTGSMQPSIDGLRKSILNIATGLRHLLDQPKEVCFGVGEVKDDSGPSGPATTGGDLSYMYRTRQKVVCEQDQKLPKIQVALKPMQGTMGGDDPEAQLIALKEAVLGTGSQRPFYIAPNQDAGFRTDALKVVVMITDETMHSGGAYPEQDEVIQIMNSAEVEFVGVHALREHVDETHAQLKQIALGTGTFAPADGVDCDGDGKFTAGIDLRPGEPLVCQTSGSDPNIGGAVVGLLLGVQDPGTIAVHVGDEHGIVQKPIDGQTAAIRNLKRESRLEFTLPLMCTKQQDGKDFEVNLLPTVRARPYNPLGSINVKCRSELPPPPEPPPVEPAIDPLIKPKPRPPMAIPLQPPVQPPAISNINLNAGFSQQEEQQYQLATVTQGAQEEAQEEEEVELAMTGLDRPVRDVAGAAVTFAGAGMLSAAASVAYRRRLQRQRRVGYVRVDR